MKPLLYLCLGAGITACTPSGDVVSSMNFLRAPIEPACAQNALLAVEGFSVKTPMVRRGGAQQMQALFNEDLAVNGIVRTLSDGTGEVSFFVKLDKDATPLEQRKARFAVQTADEAVYRACTVDGKSGSGDIILDTQE